MNRVKQTIFHPSERITILITTLLAFTVFLVEINQSLPRNSDSVPIIQLFYMTTVMECMLSFFLTCFLVRVLERKGKGTFIFRSNRIWEVFWGAGSVFESVGVTEISFNKN